jgi:hypothetical protein
MHQFIRLVIAIVGLTTLFASPIASAISVEAEGQAPINSTDPGQSREQALKRAMERASMKANTYIASTQQVRNGVLEVDDLRTDSLSQISDVRILREWEDNGQHHVRIEAEVEIRSGCKDNQHALAYSKTVAIGTFPLERPTDARLGDLGSVQRDLSALLANDLRSASAFNALDAGDINLIQNPAQAPVTMLPEGALSTLLRSSEQLNVQFLITGVIRSMASHQPVGPGEPNILVDLYNQYDRNEDNFRRDFILDLYIYEALTGTLKHQQRYQLTADWNLDKHQKTGFATAAFWQQPYGQELRKMLRSIANDIQMELTCEPFAVRITRTQGNQIWIGAGADSGLNPGDRLTVYRRYTDYDLEMRPIYELNNTGESATVERVHATQSTATLTTDARSLNIQQDDVVIAH